MKSCLLLILSVMTGCEASFQVNGCEGGWIEFTCEYPENYPDIVVDDPRGNSIRSTKKDEWEKNGRLSLYHDTKNETLRVVVKHLQKEDIGEYECDFYHDTESLVLEQEPVNEFHAVKDVCKEPFIQIVNETAKITITCDYPDKYKSKVQFICKDNNESCEEILSTSSSVKSNGTFTLTNTSSGFNVSISNVSSQHAGVYWCGVKEERNRTSVRQIQLEIVNPPNKVAIIAVPIVAVLLLVLILVLVYKRCSKRKSNEEVQNKEEDFGYEEIEEHPNNPGSGTAMKTIYVTANHPTNPSASSHYSCITHPNNSGEVSGDTYSTVKDNSQCPTYSTVNHPTGLSETPLYSTVNKPQEN